MPHHVFITGASGFIGSKLVPALIARGHSVTALVRGGSRTSFPAACTVVTADPLNGASYAANIRGADTFIHLIGVAHPSPKRAHEFHSIDLRSVEEAVPVALQAGVAQFIYLSVPQPLPVMKAYGDVRAEGEAMIKASGMKSTFIRPFYVLGPGRTWPYILFPAFWLLRIFSPAMGRRLYPVTMREMIGTLIWSVEHPPDESRIVEGVEIQRHT